MAEMRSGARGLYPFVVVVAFGLGGFAAVVFSGLVAARVVRALSWRPAFEGWRGMLPRGMGVSEVTRQCITGKLSVVSCRLSAKAAGPFDYAQGRLFDSDGGGSRRPRSGRRR